MPGVQRTAKPLNNTSTTADIDEETIAGIVAGAEVEHARFGKGKVLQVEGEAPNLKATVFFPAAGQKQLLLKFAKLRVL